MLARPSRPSTLRLPPSSRYSISSLHLHFLGWRTRSQHQDPASASKKGHDYWISYQLAERGKTFLKWPLEHQTLPLPNCSKSPFPSMHLFPPPGTHALACTPPGYFLAFSQFATKGTRFGWLDGILGAICNENWIGSWVWSWVKCAYMPKKVHIWIYAHKINDFESILAYTHELSIPIRISQG